MRAGWCRAVRVGGSTTIRRAAHVLVSGQVGVAVLVAAQLLFLGGHLSSRRRRRLDHVLVFPHVAPGSAPSLPAREATAALTNLLYYYFFTKFIYLTLKSCTKCFTIRQKTTHLNKSHLYNHFNILFKKKSLQ